MTAIRRSPRALWILTAVILAGLLVAAFVPGSGSRLPVIVIQVGFVLLHGAQRYGRRAIGIFVAAGLIISNILENLSIQTGFPFGHYHYTGGGKIFEVPWFIGPPTWPPATWPGSSPPPCSATCAAARPG
jgi:putative membrane protein